MPETVNDAMREEALSWRWVSALAVVLLLTAWGCVELLRALFPRPHPRSYVSAAYAQLSPETRAIALGSSHVSFGVDPQPYHGELVTLAAGALDFACSEPILRRILERAPNVELVLLEADVNGLIIDAVKRYRGDFYQLYALGLTIDDMPRGMYWKLRQKALESRFLYPIFYLRRLTPRALVWEGGLGQMQRAGADEAILKGFVAADDVINARNDGRVVVEYHKAEFRRDHSRVNLAALERIVTGLRQRGIRVVLLRLPKHHTYRENRPPAWNEKYEAAMARLRDRVGPDAFELWDYDALDMPDDHFMDGHHLNRRGAARLALEIQPRVQALLDAAPAH